VFSDRFAEYLQLAYDSPHDQHTRFQHGLVPDRWYSVPNELLKNGDSRLRNVMLA
jgi:hypothetical protein